jgi:hypothetical protein
VFNNIPHTVFLLRRRLAAVNKQWGEMPLNNADKELRDLVDQTMMEIDETATALEAMVGYLESIPGSHEWIDGDFMVVKRAVA